MADTPENDTAEQPAKSNKKSIVIIIVAIVVGVLIALAISYFAAMHFLANSPKQSESAVRRVNDAPGTFVKIGDPKEGIIVNIGGLNSGRYLKINMTVEIEPAKEKSKTADPQEIRIQDTVVQFLRARKIEEFDPTKQDQLKAEVKKAVESVIGLNKVYDVYITNFVLQ